MSGVSGFDYAEIRRHRDLFAGAGVFYWNDLTLTGLGNARQVNAINASASLFSVLGLKPQLGRIFSEAEDQYGAVGTTLLSDELWRSAFRGDPNVLGRIIHLNGTSYTVVGVMRTTGTRQTIVIPTGEIGNDSTINARREFWFSPELGLNLISVRGTIRALACNVSSSPPSC